MFLVSYVSHVFPSAHCCLVVTCWERAGLLALVGDVYCIFVSFPCVMMGQVWYLVVSFPDLCRLSFFQVTLDANFTVTRKAKEMGGGGGAGTNTS